MGFIYFLINHQEFDYEHVSTHAKLCWLAGITLFGCVGVRFQIKTRQVFRQLRQILPRVTGKTGDICPSPVSYIYTADDAPHTCSKSLLHLNQTGSGAAGSAAAVVVFTTTRHFQISDLR